MCIDTYSTTADPTFINTFSLGASRSVEGACCADEFVYLYIDTVTNGSIDILNKSNT